MTPLLKKTRTLQRHTLPLRRGQKDGGTLFFPVVLVSRSVGRDTGGTQGPGLVLSTRDVSYHSLYKFTDITNSVTTDP